MSALELQESLAKLALTRQRIAAERLAKRTGPFKPKPRSYGKLYVVEWKPEPAPFIPPWWNER